MATSKPNVADLVELMPETDRSSPQFSGDDFKNLPALADKLRNGPNALFKFLRQQLSPATAKLVDEFGADKKTGPALQTALAKDFNKILQDPALYEPQRFEGAAISGETRALCQQRPKGGTLLRGNRALLEEACPEHLSKVSDKRGKESKFTGPDPELAAKACEELLAGGRESVLELIGMIRDPGDPEFKSYKAEYFLHIVAVHTGRPGKEAQRKMVAAAMASQLGNEKLSRVVRAFLVRQLQRMGDGDVAPALGALLSDEVLCEHAAAALISINTGAAGQLRKAWPGAQGKCRLIVLQSLAAVRDEQSLATLRKAITDDDREVRLAAAWGLARIGDGSDVDLLLKAAEVPTSWERIKATQACLVLAEKLVADQKKADAARIYTHLRDTRTDHTEQYLREAAGRALEAMK